MPIGPETVFGTVAFVAIAMVSYHSTAANLDQRLDEEIVDKKSGVTKLPDRVEILNAYDYANGGLHVVAVLAAIFSFAAVRHGDIVGAAILLLVAGVSTFLSFWRHKILREAREFWKIPASAPTPAKAS